jgi:hypothetical protein
MKRSGADERGLTAQAGSRHLDQRYPETFINRSYADLRRDTPMPRGGHFAALEEPDLLTADIRAFFRSLR